MAIFRTAKSRSYETKRMPKTDSSGQKTQETVSIVERAFQFFFCRPVLLETFISVHQYGDVFAKIPGQFF